MPETTIGIGILLDRLLGIGTPTPFDPNSSRIGVGDGVGGVPVCTPGDTALTATVNTAWKEMDPGYPQRDGTTATWQATFGPGEAEFAWNEWAIDNGNNGGPGQLLNHKGAAKGVKPAGSTWTYTVHITHS